MGISRLKITTCGLTVLLLGQAWLPLASEKKIATPDPKVALGKMLFFDTRLSYNQTKSCASCHDPKFAFTDGYRTSAGADGYTLRRNAPSLLNAVYRKQLTWGDSTIKSFIQQLAFPFFNKHPKELGQEKTAHTLLESLKNDSTYQRCFKAVFGSSGSISLEQVFDAIAAYEKTLVSFNSSFDRYVAGDEEALTKDQQMGMQLFFSNRLHCGTCHAAEQKKQMTSRYENIGLYNILERGNYPEQDQGLYHVTKQTSDKGKFRVPSLRNVLLTAPYTHDGSVATIEEMIDIYAAGGRQIVSGHSKGDGRKNPFKSHLVKGFTISPTEKKQLIAFLDALTDTSYLLLNP